MYVSNIHTHTHTHTYIFFHFFFFSEIKKDLVLVQPISSNMVAQYEMVTQTRFLVRVPGSGSNHQEPLASCICDLSRLSLIAAAAAAPPLPRILPSAFQSPPSSTAAAAAAADNNDKTSRKRKRMEKDSEGDNSNVKKSKNNNNNNDNPPRVLLLRPLSSKLLQERENLRKENQRLTARLEQLQSIFRNKEALQYLGNQLAQTTD